MKKRIRARIFISRMLTSFFCTMLVFALIAGMARVSALASSTIGKSAATDIFSAGRGADIHNFMEAALCLRGVVIGVFPYVVLFIDIAFAVCVRIANAVAGSII